MNRIHQIIAFLVSLLILLLVFEGGLRLIGFAPKSTMNRFDSALGWAKTPSTAIRRHTGEFDVTFATNSRGLREDESVGYEKPGGTQRVLVVGDSFTLGYTVDRPETITQLLQDELRAQGRSVQVVNAGTEGYSTDQEVLWLAREGAKYDPDVVILQMYENDIFWNSQDHYLRYPKPHLRGDGDPSGGPDSGSAGDAAPDGTPACGAGITPEPGLVVTAAGAVRGAAVGATYAFLLHLADGREWLVAGRFTAADIAVGYACLLAANLKLLDGLGPLTRAWWARCEARDGYRRAKAAQAADAGAVNAG